MTFDLENGKVRFLVEELGLLMNQHYATIENLKHDIIDRTDEIDHLYEKIKMINEIHRILRGKE